VENVYRKIIYVFSYVYCILSFVGFCSASELSELENLTGYDIEYDIDCNIDYLEEIDDLESLGKYKDMYKTYLIISEIEEKSYGVISKFKKSIKKKVFRLFKRLACKAFFQSTDHFGYSVAYSKKRLDKLSKKNKYSTEKFIKKLDEKLPKIMPEKDRELIKNKIKFFIDNKHASPKSDFELAMEMYNEFQKPEYHGELDHIPVAALFGGVEVACGLLIVALPFPGCIWLGQTLMSTGIGTISAAYIKKYIDEHPETLKVAG